jgi:SHAQKYF class myb-like DNA-binding protein
MSAQSATAMMTADAAAALALTFAARPQPQQEEALKAPLQGMAELVRMGAGGTIKAQSDKIKGFWTKREQDAFVQGLSQHGKDWKKIKHLVQTRTLTQIRTHAQKYFKKLVKKESPSLGGLAALSSLSSVSPVMHCVETSNKLPPSPTQQPRILQTATANSTIQQMPTLDPLKAVSAAIAHDADVQGVAQDLIRLIARPHQPHAAMPQMPQLSGNINPNALRTSRADRSNISYGRWSETEQSAFVLGLELHGKNWKKIQPMVRTRTLTQLRTHAQKYYAKLARRQGKQVKCVPSNLTQNQNQPPPLPPVPAGAPPPPVTATESCASLLPGGGVVTSGLVYRNVRDV